MGYGGGAFRRVGARGAKNSQNALPEENGVCVQHWQNGHTGRR